MTKLKTQFVIIKVEEDIWDVAIFGDTIVLKAFEKVYGGFYVEKSIFDQMPMCVIAEFPNENHAEIWKQYWLKAFNDPDNSCKTCPTVNQLFQIINNGK